MAATVPLRSGPVAPGIAFITGGARGLGNAIAQSFAKEGAAGVVIVDIQDEATFATGKAAVEQFGTRCFALRADVTKEEQIAKAVADAVVEFGRIDYAANFAGIVGPLDKVVETDVEAWRRVIEVNTIGVWLSIKHELKQMLNQTPHPEVEAHRIPQQGSIINAASVNSILGGAGTTGYTASKHAVLGMTKAAALEARENNVRINCVSPGFLLTKLLEEPIQSGVVPPDVWKQYEARQGRGATYDEIGDVVVLLSTPRMSLVVGHNLVIDGGFTINENNF
jgi:NAD(P)-dependent dehydrogenase (short-subunit alcohol dehydrogenase family)